MRSSSTCFGTQPTRRRLGYREALRRLVMRLCFEPETGRQKILQDIKLNMPEPEKVLDDALELARAMGREEQIRQHVAWVQARMQRAS